MRRHLLAAAALARASAALGWASAALGWASAALARAAAVGPALALAAALLAPLPARAVDLADGKLSLHGDGEWALRLSNHRNDVGEATPVGNYDTAMFDLVLVARPAPDLVISAQLGFDAGETTAEWVFAEYRVSEALRLRVGKVQQPFGNSNELRFAGTTRALFDLPRAVYGPSNVTGTTYLGAGLTGEGGLAPGWTLAYDAYAGAVKLAELEGYRVLEGAGADEPIVAEAQQVRELAGGRLSLTTPCELVLRLSGFGGRIGVDEGHAEGFASWGLSAQYRGDRLWFSAEAFHSVEFHSEHALAGHATAAWFLTERLQAVAGVESLQTWLKGGVGRGSPLLRHRAWSAGLAWWVNPGLVFKAVAQGIDGNRLALPSEATFAGLAAEAPATRTTVLTVGTQFAF